MQYKHLSLRNSLVKFLWLAMVSLFCGNSVTHAVEIRYRLPFDGTQKTYRVTIAAAPVSNPDWIVSTFAAGLIRTVNKENQGRFIDFWDGLDDNFMPVSPGEYVLKGIYAPGEIWATDGQVHSLIPEYKSSPGDSWAAASGEGHRFPAFHGHVFEPVYEVVPATNRTALVLGGFVENGFNPFIMDLNKPPGPDQIIKRFPSHGCSGGQLAAYDGRHAWINRRKEIYSPSQAGFGLEKNKYGRGFSRSDGDHPPTDLTAIREGNQTHLLLSEPRENRVAVMDGKSGKILNAMNLPGVRATAQHPRDGRLFALCRNEVGWHIMETKCIESSWEKALYLPDTVQHPWDLAVDHDGMLYTIEGRTIVQFNRSGRIIGTYGKNKKLNGKWDPEVMIRPNRIHTWRNKDGRNLLIVTTIGAPQRIVEWDTQSGRICRDWMLTQNAAGGFCMDPENPDHVYTTALIEPQLIRYTVNYATGAWRVNAVWEDICHLNADTDFPGGRMFPQILHHEGRKYLCFSGGAYRSRGGWMIYRYQPEKDDWIPSAGTVSGSWWHDANGDGEFNETEITGICPPSFNGNYWAGKFLPGLVPANINNNTWFWQFKAPHAFDGHGNPVYREGSIHAVTDPFVHARLQGKGENLDPLYGGNEIGRKYWNWSDLTGSIEDGIFVASVHKPDGITGYKYDEAGQVCAEWKLTRWERNPKGAFDMRWRVGRKAFGAARPGEVYAPFNISAPVYGLLGFQDGNGLYHVYTTDGLYVDTLFYDRFRFGNMERGGMFSHSGGSYYGRHYHNKSNGKVYVFMGRASNNIYAVPNWQPGFVQPIEIENRNIVLMKEDISKPPAHVARLRSK